LWPKDSYVEGLREQPQEEGKEKGDAIYLLEASMSMDVMLLFILTNTAAWRLT
jgi:hypothetical protein